MSATQSSEVTVSPQEMALLSNLMAAYSFVADQPERAALVFLGGVSVGLLITLCAIVFQIHCRADCRFGKSNKPQQHHHRHGRRRHGNGRHHHQHQHHHHTCPRHHAIEGNPDSAALVPVGRGGPGQEGGGGEEEEEEEELDDTSDLSARRRRRFERALLNATMFTSAEELDRAQRLEDRERILREIWMNGQPDISTVTQSLNRYY